MIQKILALATLCFVALSPAQANPQELTRLMEELRATTPDGTAYALHMIDKDGSFGTVMGATAPDGAPIDENSLFRIASNTKTYVAVALMRLWEQGKVKLDAPIATLISADFDAVMKADGYDTSAMTVQQVLNHTSGLFGHFLNKEYIGALLDNPQRVWTPLAQVEAMAAWGDPVGKPGEKYSYSDTGYIIIGQIIERLSGKTLPIAIRDLIGFEKLGLEHTAWERGDTVTAKGTRVHQYFRGHDTYDWDASIDLFGGGGVVASVSDLAVFISSLFDGKIFDKPSTLERMLSAEGIPTESKYRMGLFVHEIAGRKVYEHSGFWGTLIYHDPETNTTLAGAGVDSRNYRPLNKAIKNFLAQP